MQSKNFKEILASLYSILIWSDGSVDEKEISSGRKMAQIVGIDEILFTSQIKALKTSPPQELLSEAIVNLKVLPRDEQILCVSWLCIIANADGFMDKAEWQMIYRIYYHELQLTLDEIMQMQKKLNQIILKKNTPYVAVL